MVNILFWIVVIVLVILAWVIIKKLIKIAFIIVIAAVVIFLVLNFFNVLPGGEEGLDFVTLPEGFEIEVFTEVSSGSLLSLPGPNAGPRMMGIKEDTIFVTIPKQGKVIALETKEEKVEPKTFIEGLNNPHGVDFYQDWVYIAEEDKVIRVKDAGGIADMETVEKLVDLPSGEGHWTRTVKIVNGKMLISIGSSCNVCEEEDARRGTIQECNLDGSNCESYAQGLRNSVGFVEYDGKIFATDNGRDLLGNDLPPDEINQIEKGKNYGWPTCYGKQIRDTDFDKNVYIRNPCVDTEGSFADLQAHSAPLGLAFYDQGGFPTEYNGDLFVAYHGSWNREPPTGYKIVRFDAETGAVEDFATGWLEGKDVKGRPVDLIFFKDSLLVTDDNTGKIYRISYTG